MQHEDEWYPIASLLRQRRAELGLSRDEVARRVDVTRSTIHNWESGRGFPIERCAAIADALEIDRDQLIAVHPSGQSQGAVAQVPPPQLQRAGLLLVVVLLVASAGFAWSSLRADCKPVGSGGGSLIGSFQAAFERYGGEAVLGCPINEVQKWGPGYLQDFQGGSTGRSSLMSLDRQQVYVMAGPIWWDYVAIAQGSTPDFVGYPVTDPLQCGDAIVTLLDGGIDGPGALVSSVEGRYVWLSADLWTAYAELGGPAGPLGQPLGVVQRSPETEVVRFEQGGITHPFGEATISDPQQLPASIRFDPARCQVATLVDVALAEFRVDKPERQAPPN